MFLLERTSLMSCLVLNPFAEISGALWGQGEQLQISLCRGSRETTRRHLDQRLPVLTTDLTSRFLTRAQHPRLALIANIILANPVLWSQLGSPIESPSCLLAVCSSIPGSAFLWSCKRKPRDIPTDGHSTTSTGRHLTLSIIPYIHSALVVPSLTESRATMKGRCKTQAPGESFT